MEETMNTDYIAFRDNRVTLTHPAGIPGGVVAAIPSKSHAHRLLIAAALSEAPVRLLCPTTSKDIDATAVSLSAMGATIRRIEDGFLVDGSCRKSPASTENTGIPQAPEDMPRTLHPSDETPGILQVGESGSTLRFLLPILGALGCKAELHMQGRLSQRPLSPLYEEMCRHGVTLSPQGENPLRIEGTLTPGDYQIDGGVSSQYITGLLFALPLLSDDSRLTITGRLESRPYVDITLQVLREFGITVKCAEGPDISSVPGATVRFDIPGGQHYRYRKENDASNPAERSNPPVCRVEGDWSNAAFFLTAGAIQPGAITVTGCNQASAQGDQAIVSLLARFGATITTKPSVFSTGHTDITVSGGKLHAIEIDAADIPDLVPILSVASAYAEGTTIIRNIGRLRIKESDRVATVLEMLLGLGADASVEQDTSGEYLRITGKPTLRGGTVSSHNDHRIAMAAAIASLGCTGPVTIEDSMAVSKSYPGFYADLEEILRPSGSRLPAWSIRR